MVTAASWILKHIGEVGAILLNNFRLGLVSLKSIAKKGIAENQCEKHETPEFSLIFFAVSDKISCSPSSQVKPVLMVSFSSHSHPWSDSTTLPWSLGHTSHLGTILIVILVPVRECQE